MEFYRGRTRVKLGARFAGAPGVIRHYFTSALRNLAANRIQSIIAIAGLSIGIAAALLISLLIRSQLTFDHFIPGYDRLYVAMNVPIFDPATAAKAARAGITPIHTPADFRTAPVARLNIPELDATYLPSDSRVFHRGQVTAREDIFWADSHAFTVLPFPILYGDLTKAMDRPDGIVLTQKMAWKYFGRENVVGQTIDLDDRPMTVMAVLKDQQSSTSFDASFASALSPASIQTGEIEMQKTWDVRTGSHSAGMTYVRLKPSASFDEVMRKFPTLLPLLWNPNNAKRMSFELIRNDRIKLLRDFNPALDLLNVMALAGFLVLFIACTNFVNLLTARAARRSIEVGMRKVCGAGRGALILQFLGETFVTVFAATIIAVAITEWLLPSFNALSKANASFDYWQDPLLLAWMMLGAIVLTLLAGAYPAFVLSGFRPAQVLKGWTAKIQGGNFIRNILVVIQFVIFMTMIIAAAIISQQRNFAVAQAMRLDTDQMLLVRTDDKTGCPVVFKLEARILPGVGGVACSDYQFLGYGSNTNSSGIKHNGEQLNAEFIWLEPGIFSLYGIKPLAGSLAGTSPSGDWGAGDQGHFVLNQAAIRKLGFPSAQEAIGLPVTPDGMFDKATAGRVVAVVPDFSFQPVNELIPPMRYNLNPPPSPTYSAVVSIKLSGHKIPETLAAIDEAWGRTVPGKPIDRQFLDDRIQKIYETYMDQARYLAIAAGVAVFLACLGLLGLSISTAERRTKEIGVRKAMGANSFNILNLLLWQFVKPILWATAFAWPIGFYVMNNWLNGWAYHVTLGPLPFFAALVLAVAIALLTVAAQALRTARAVPATALRYE